jgi:hypothetical protein
MTHHELKTTTPYWAAVAAGVKPFDLRFNDRGFEPQDTVTLRETERGADGRWFYTGRSVNARISYVLPLDDEPFDLADGYVVFGLVGVSAIHDDAEPQVFP